MPPCKSCQAKQRAIQHLQAWIRSLRKELNRVTKKRKATKKKILREAGTMAKGKE